MIEEEEKKQKTIEDLNSIYRKADEIDKKSFADMRSNILLVSGDHYSRKSSKIWNRIRDSRSIDAEKKLRLTKNHIQRITKIYRNNILKFTPGVKCLPQLDTELQDVKAAEMNQAVWTHIKKMNKHSSEIAKYAQDFIDIGEVAVKVYFDPNKGHLKGYEPMVDEETGQPVMENQEVVPVPNPETGEVVEVPVPGTGTPAMDKSKPVFSGKVCHERVFGFNLLRDPAAKCMDESPYLLIRKMISKKEAMMLTDDPEKKNKIKTGNDETYMVFNGGESRYGESKDQVMIKELFYRPSMEYPRGYYYIYTDDVILFEDELPGGVFPICVQGFDEIQTTARMTSIIKQLRPYQAEVNISSSQKSTQQITLGDDKVVISNGAKVTSGGTLPGVRIIKTNSPNGSVQVIPGRSGEQFVNYIAGQIDEMYLVANLKEDLARRQDGNVDIWGSLYGSLKSKKEFSIYSSKFECFLTDLCKTSLMIARYNLPDDEIIEMVGKRETVNMEEFRNNKDLGYQIKIEPSTDDADSLMGKQQMINHALQYVGKNMDKEQIGMILKESPIGNMSEIFSDMTIDHENAKNDILQLERAQIPKLNQYEDTQYKIKKIVNRMKQSDFDYLDPQVQQAFQQFLQMCEQVEAQKLAAKQRIDSGFIPDSGGLITINGIKDKEGRVVRVPYSSIEWLWTKLGEQGAAKTQLDSANNGVQVDISQMLPPM